MLHLEHFPQIIYQEKVDIFKKYKLQGQTDFYHLGSLMYFVILSASKLWKEMTIITFQIIKLQTGFKTWVNLSSIVK